MLCFCIIQMLQIQLYKTPVFAIVTGLNVKTKNVRPIICIIFEFNINVKLDNVLIILLYALHWGSLKTIMWLSICKFDIK